MKFIHLTDTHLVAPGVALHGLDPEQRLEACVAHIERHHSDARFCVLTGDVADAGQMAAYEATAVLLERLPMPVYVVPGNHDERNAFVAAFPQLARDEHGFVQQAFCEDNAWFIVLDTLEAAQGSGGVFCERRAAWLAERLRAAGERPVYLFMHHPPFPLGLPALDRIGLADVRPFESALSHSTSVRHIFFGHVHRPISGHWRGISFSTLYGTNHQVRLDFEHSDYLAYTAEPPAYAIVLVDEQSLVVHTCHFLEDTADIKEADSPATQ